MFIIDLELLLFFFQFHNFSFNFWINKVHDIFTIHDLRNNIIFPLIILQHEMLLPREVKDSWSTIFILEFFKSFLLLFSLLFFINHCLRNVGLSLSIDLRWLNDLYSSKIIFISFQRLIFGSHLHSVSHQFLTDLIFNSLHQMFIFR